MPPSNRAQMADGGPFGEMVLGERHAHLTNSLLQARCQKKKSPRRRGAPTHSGGKGKDVVRSCFCTLRVLQTKKPRPPSTVTGASLIAGGHPNSACKARYGSWISNAKVWIKV
jgi:hypothetical protein